MCVKRPIKNFCSTLELRLCLETINERNKDLKIDVSTFAIAMEDFLFFIFLLFPNHLSVWLSLREQLIVRKENWSSQVFGRRLPYHQLTNFHIGCGYWSMQPCYGFENFCMASSRNGHILVSELELWEASLQLINANNEVFYSSNWWTVWLGWMMEIKLKQASLCLGLFIYLFIFCRF